MIKEPQIAANQDKNYLQALKPLFFATIMFCNTACYAAKSDDDLKKLRALANKYLAATNANKETDNEDSKNNKKDDEEDQAQQDSVREAIPLWERKSLNNRSWSEHVYDELPLLGPDLLATQPTDAKIFCPNYKNLSTSERKQFWAFFISSMVKFESNFDPKSAFTESFRDSTGRYVISRGLLQLSYESSKSYRCGFSTAKEIHNPTENLSCGIKILNHWMKKDGRIASKTSAGWRGGARYWSVLRAGRKDSYMSIVKWSNNLPFCKL